MYESTPAKPKRITILEYSEPYSHTGITFRAFEGPTSLCMGEETREKLVKRLKEFYPTCTIEGEE